ncbi:kelch-like protein 12 [Lingula anatina]|uniref:Kelch-like protein 12 n=1 Tax=Lingula anatina TaxID=7574 RepID=A0A1S3HU90_LINAN|nr:kelch-like protein 12 [Lingula anatina]XP_013388625.1 kelch-like protein 12 [Lingula anatina]XP_013388627.1 kelch-like protein 12 [Lingula anatina]XP_013388628.1 kelch-like protein 12 [Lingula anatina]XP_013388629.1 kelch-like protein 12 [Lingula anatina]XP_013388630.1 kelch-like protein 12 [Lingula anatina]XP_013388631.1 kelch-like protein 12 [Lingula anatina]XP_013388632.1 kelch-like protein 12 [Lingula anatina]|eukprot:XP_013388624.1 kelch-like protein 12 [Lingula anatina]
MPNSGQEPPTEEVMALESLPGLFGSFEEGYIHEYYFSETSHALALLQGLNHQRAQSILCDVIICVDGQDFPCHRNVLAACSPYFLAMFTGDMKESIEKRINISGICANIMKQLIDYAYTASITITRENAQQLLSAANLVQIQSIREACCKFLEKEMDPSNCLGIHCFAEAHVCLKLSEKAKQFTEGHFTEVSRHEEILLLPQNKLVELISSDELEVENEEIVFDAVLSWVKHEPDTRAAVLADVLQYVRLPLVSPYFLFDKMEKESVLRLSPDCRALIDEALKFFILKDRRLEMESPRIRPRKCMATTEMIMTIGGEIFNKNYLNCVDCYDFQEGRWWKLKELPFPRCHHSAVLSDNQHVYIAGGFNKDKVVLNNVLRYEKVLDKWIRVASMNTPRARHGMTTLDGVMYVLGGYDGQARVDTVEKYCPETNTWSFVQSLGVAVSRCQAVGFNGFLYVAGGVVDPSNQCTEMFQRYNPRIDQWETLAPMPQPACLSALLVARNQLYAVGGTTDMVTASRQLCLYDVERNRWSELSPMTETRFDAGAATINGKIYVLSGHDGENSFFSNVEEYDLDTDTWKIVPNITLPFGRCRFGCVAMRLNRK